jgi:hypothetical protein
MNRETWLENMTDRFLINHFKAGGYDLAEIRDRLKFSCSFIKGLRGSKNGKAIGVHYHPIASEKGFHEIMIEPSISESSRAVDILIHEICHALTLGDGHGKLFKRCALSVGLTGKMTATIASDDLKLKIDEWVQAIGEYPHAKLTLNDSRKKQSTRLIKAECSCGYNVRMSRKWINEIGTPICPACEIQMTAEGEEEEEEGE